jgi:hypothetical protein
MSNVDHEGRSFEPITHDDLLRLRQIAEIDLQQLFARQPKCSVYESRVLCITLCQGAAQHYVEGKKGINDFDVFTFFRRHPTIDWPNRRRTIHDFGDPKFGVSLEQSKPGWVGRRVDCMGRAIHVQADEYPVEALRRYLREQRTNTARHLAAQAVVLLNPACGDIIWPEKRP